MRFLIADILTVIQALLALAAVGYIVWLTYLFAVPGYAEGPPYVPTKASAAAAMLSLLGASQGETVIDLGSGDGRLLIAAAKTGCRAVGYELNLPLVLWSRLTALRQGVGRSVRVRWGNFWKADLSRADVVMVFGFSTMMERLGGKFAAELRPGARIICERYALPGWTPLAERDGIYLYKKEG
ncbi:MAG TPA: hypothetical protein VL426_00960 [Candidatus Binatia bacterium]|nr:hypothetical protein [Candidatus Binatia bacterium]